MRIPDSPRVIYQRNPLVGVTCQLNFPAILRISTEPPVAFQERIRHLYPVFQEQGQIDINLQLPPQLAQAVKPLMRSGMTTYQFIDDSESEDSGTWTVSLTHQSLSLATSKYVRWEEFREHFARPFQSFLDIYQPSFFSRVGLRYQNMIIRSNIGIDGVPWKDLLNGYIAGLLAIADDEDDIEQGQTQLVLRLDDDRKVLLRHGIVIPEGYLESGYLIDNDFFNDKRTEALHAGSILDSLNEASGSLFRWCITDRLHSALEPASS